MKRRFRLALSGACAILAASICMLYGQEVRAEAEQERSEALTRFGGDTVGLVVANEALEVGDVVGRQNVGVRDWASSLVPDGSITSMDDCAGKVVTVPLAKGAPVTELNFRASEDAIEVPAGYIALQVLMTEKLGLPSSVSVGSRLVAYEVSDEGTKVICSDAQTLSVPVASAGASRPQVSIAARPGDVSALLRASAEGSLRLVLPSSETEEAVEPVAPSAVVSNVSQVESPEGGE